MCGIFVSVSQDSSPCIPFAFRKALADRGPDCQNTIHRVERYSDGTSPRDFRIVAHSSVLGLRGETTSPQPHQFEDPRVKSFLCWNGELWSYNGSAVQENDGKFLFCLLVEACHLQLSNGTCKENSLRYILGILALCEGPFAFVFFDGAYKRLIFGRDELGRRSLLIGTNEETQSYQISSVLRSAQMDTYEMRSQSIMIHELDSPLTHRSDKHTVRDFANFRHITWSNIKQQEMSFPPLNRVLNFKLSRSKVLDLETTEEILSRLQRLLQAAIHKRIPCLRGNRAQAPRGRLAILFSGGLDCSLIAAELGKILKPGSWVELLNVAFENPRKGTLGSGTTDSIFERCPDRLTGRRSLKILKSIYPSISWQFITINVSYTDVIHHQRYVQRLMSPHTTEMDNSIALALYFGARARGLKEDNFLAQPSNHASKARVLFSGLGADELFGGYHRYRSTFRVGGYSAVLDELEKDFGRIASRNLGRDDRIISSYGKEIRYPFLDDDVVKCALQCPVMLKCAFDLVDENDLPADKYILRLLARRLRLTKVAGEPKRAIQFGSSSAKLYTRKAKGTDVMQAICDDDAFKSARTAGLCSHGYIHLPLDWL